MNEEEVKKIISEADRIKKELGDYHWLYIAGVSEESVKAYMNRISSMENHRIDPEDKTEETIQELRGLMSGWKADEQTT